MCSNAKTGMIVRTEKFPRIQLAAAVAPLPAPPCCAATIIAAIVYFPTDAPASDETEPMGTTVPSLESPWPPP